jgi:hypothetical protein
MPGTPVVGYGAATLMIQVRIEAVRAVALAPAAKCPAVRVRLYAIAAQVGQASLAPQGVPPGPGLAWGRHGGSGASMRVVTENRTRRRRQAVMAADPPEPIAATAGRAAVGDADAHGMHLCRETTMDPM